LQTLSAQFFDEKLLTASRALTHAFQEFYEIGSENERGRL
jgi:hypothetical protein